VTSPFDISRNEARCPKGNAAAATAQDRVAKGTTSMACRVRSLPRHFSAVARTTRVARRICAGYDRCLPQADPIDGSLEKGKALGYASARRRSDKFAVKSGSLSVEARHG
jgi:hypothetical protein